MIAGVSIGTVLVLLIAVVTWWLVVNPNSVLVLNPGQAMPTTDQVSGSMQCETPRITMCLATIANDAVSRHTIHWEMVKSVPTARSNAPTTGTLSPGATASIEITYPEAIARICPLTLIFSVRPETSLSSRNLTITWRCSLSSGT